MIEASLIAAPHGAVPSGSALRRALVPVAAAPPIGWRADLRFFAIAYALGLVFFLLLLG